MSEIGSGSGSSYPTSLDTNSTPEVNSPNVGKTKARAEVPNDLASAVVAIETELGTDPAGTTTDVKTFLQVEHQTDGTHGAITPTSVAATGQIATTSTLIASGAVTFGSTANIAGVLTATAGATISGGTTTIDSKYPLLITAADASTIAGPGQNGTLATTDQAYRRRINMNGAPLVWQQGTSFTAATTPANSDDTYCGPDGWILLSDGNDIVDVSRGTTVATGGLYSVDAAVQTVSKKFGWLIPIELKDAAPLLGGTASISFDAKVTSAAAGRLDNIKAVLLSWDSTADTITSDVVSAWGAEDTTPTWAANWTAENVPANLGVTATVARYSINGISVDTASATNVALFIWADGLTGTASDTLYLSNVQIEATTTATPFEWRGYDEELAKCQRYYFKGDVGNAGGLIIFSGDVTNAIIYYAHLTFPVTMRTTPTCTGTNVTNSAFAAAAGTLAPATNGVREARTATGTGNGGYFMTSIIADARL